MIKNQREERGRLEWTEAGERFTGEYVARGDRITVSTAVARRRSPRASPALPLPCATEARRAARGRAKGQADAPGCSCAKRLRGVAVRATAVRTAGPRPTRR